MNDITCRRYITLEQALAVLPGPLSERFEHRCSGSLCEWTVWVMFYKPKGGGAARAVAP